MTDFDEILVGSFESFKEEWAIAERYFERGEKAKIQDSLRRFGYVFHRLGYLPDAQKYGSLANDLKEIGQTLRNLSSTEKYFLELSCIGGTLDPITAKVLPVIGKIDNIRRQIQST